MPSPPDNRAISCHIAVRASGSRPAVGSSRNRICGRCTRPRATSRRRCMPPEYVLTRRPAASARSNRSSSSSARARTAAPRMPNRWPCRMRFSRPVAIGSLPDFCATTPIRRRTWSGRLSTSRPCTTAVPWSGRASVVRILMVVDLPAPFGPSRPKITPRGTVMLSPSRARTPSRRPRTAYVFTRPLASMAFPSSAAGWLAVGEAWLATVGDMAVLLLRSSVRERRPTGRRRHSG